MKNRKFHWLLSEPREGKRPKWTIEKVAAAIYCGRAAVNQVLSNTPGRGKQTRPKLVKFFKKEFPERWPEILASLGWDEEGNVTRETFHMERQPKVSLPS